MISHQFKTIFVHIPKTAGQSVESVFLEAHGLDWDSRAPLLLRLNEDPANGPNRLAHLYADEYVRLGHVTQAQFDEYFKFAIVRDPFDRIISEYRYRPNRMTGQFFQFVNRKFKDDFSDLARHMALQTRYLYDESGRLLVNKVVRFEKLAEELPEIFARTIGVRRPLPHVNKAGSKRRSFGFEDMSWFSRRAVRRRYAEDFRILGYPTRR